MLKYVIVLVFLSVLGGLGMCSVAVHGPIIEPTNTKENLMRAQLMEEELNRISSWCSELVEQIEAHSRGKHPVNLEKLLRQINHDCTTTNNNIFAILDRGAAARKREANTLGVVRHE